MRYDIVLNPLPLAREIDRPKVARDLSQKFTSASSTGVLKPEVLQYRKPNKRQEVNNDNVWPHQIKHVAISLQLIHQG